MIDAPTVYTEKEVVARKRHDCYECTRTIVPGEPYAAISGLWDGRWDRFKLCRRCRAASKALHRDYTLDFYEPPFAFGELRATLRERVILRASIRARWNPRYYPAELCR